MKKVFYNRTDDFIVKYPDNILIYSNTKGDHLRHLRIVLERMQDKDSYIGQNKFELMKKGSGLFGLMVDSNGFKIGKEQKKFLKNGQSSRRFPN